MRYLLILMFVFSACSSTKPVLGKFYFNYEVTNKRASKIIQVFDDGERTYFKVAPGFKEDQLVTDSAVYILSGEGSLKSCTCSFMSASLGSSTIKRIPLKKRQRTVLDAIKES